MLSQETTKEEQQWRTDLRSSISKGPLESSTGVNLFMFLSELQTKSGFK